MMIYGSEWTLNFINNLITLAQQNECKDYVVGELLYKNLRVSSL